MVIFASNWSSLISARIIQIVSKNIYNHEYSIQCVCVEMVVLNFCIFVFPQVGKCRSSHLFSRGFLRMLESEGLLFQSDCQRHLALAGPQEGLQVEGRDVETIFWLQGKFHHARGLIFQPPHIVHPSIAGIFTKGQDYFAQWACSTATSVGNCAGESENSVQASIFGGRCPSCWGAGRPSGPQTHTQQVNYWRHL